MLMGYYMRLIEKSLAFFFHPDRMHRSIRSDALLRTAFRWIQRSLSPPRFSVKEISDPSRNCCRLVVDVSFASLNFRVSLVSFDTFGKMLFNLLPTNGITQTQTLKRRDTMFLRLKNDKVIRLLSTEVQQRFGRARYPR